MSEVLSWQPSDVDGHDGMVGAMAVSGDYEFHVSGPWAHIDGQWILAMSRVSDPENRAGLPDAHKFADRYDAQRGAERCAGLLHGYEGGRDGDG